jgi:hypothetical protein
MNEETIMTEKESIQLITSMINKAKNNFSEKGFLYLIWGWVILFCCVTNFVGAYFFNYDKISFVWLIIYLVIIFQIIYLRKIKKARAMTTYTSEINAFVWIVFTICLMLIIFICVAFKRFELIDPMLLILYGMPTFLSGVILKFKPLMVGAVCCWTLAIISPFINVQYQLLLIWKETGTLQK